MRHPTLTPSSGPSLGRRLGRRAGCGRAALALLLGSAAGGPALAQGLDSSLITTTIAQRFEVDSNFGLDDPSPGTSYFTDTRLGIGVLNETETQVLSFGIDTGVRALWEAEQDFELVAGAPSTVRGGYSQEWSSAALDTEFRWRRNQVNFQRGLEDFIDPDTGEVEVPDDLEQLEGDTIQNRYDAAVDVALATDAPSSYAFSLLGTHIGYSDETANRTPRTTALGEALWRLELTPVLSGALIGNYYYYTADNEVETEIREAEVDVGVIFEPSEVFSLTAGIGYAQRTQEALNLNTGDRETVQDDAGPSLRTELTYAFENFIVNGEARYTTAAPDPRLEGNLQVAYPLPRGTVNARVFQRFTSGSGGDQVKLTGAGLGLVHEINQVSRFGLDFTAAVQENQDDPEEGDITRLGATATYGYDITEVVVAQVGYQFTNRQEDPPDESDATSHAVFFEIARTFETRP